jgi:hypothetical protein
MIAPANPNTAAKIKSQTRSLDLPILIPKNCSINAIRILIVAMIAILSATRKNILLMRVMGNKSERIRVEIEEKRFVESERVDFLNYAFLITNDVCVSLVTLR